MVLKGEYLPAPLKKYDEVRDPIFLYAREESRVLGAEHSGDAFEAEVQ